MSLPICDHQPTWATSSSSPGIKEWQQGSCSRCGTYAIYHDGSWKFGQLPLRVMELAAERDAIREAVALHARTLDDLALGKPENQGRDRDDIDNNLYNVVRETSPAWWDAQVPGLNGPADTRREQS
jgi:hypothetical protein